ncbi:MAG: cytochrome c3 family protein [Rubrivivax sp.]
MNRSQQVPWVERACRQALRAAAAGLAALLTLGAVGPAQAQADPPVDVPTLFQNRDTVGKTRHNLTQFQVGGGGPDGTIMNRTRNDYLEVCVYCHTPHGANTSTPAPLWNRTMRVTTYQTYDLLNTVTRTQPVTQPGTASLTCLSCHDGQTAVDSIINMPGSGRYNPAANRDTVQNNAFLNTWDNPRGTPVKPTTHGRIGTECMGCHNPLGGGTGATDFTAFVIGTDLRNDHPVGILFPPNAGAAGSDFNDPSRKESLLAYYDRNGNQRADANEIRLYNSGQGYEVECASCHDPHGVPSAGPGSEFNPTFLRVSNAGSAVCLTCHSK